MLGDKLHVGLLFGLGLNSSKFPDQDERNNDWGVDIGGTLQYNLVTWKHLSLYLGGNLVLGVIDPTGDDNTASDIQYCSRRSASSYRVLLVWQRL